MAADVQIRGRTARVALHGTVTARDAGALHGVLDQSDMIAVIVVDMSRASCSEATALTLLCGATVSAAHRRQRVLVLGSAEQPAWLGAAAARGDIELLLRPDADIVVRALTHPDPAYRLPPAGPELRAPAPAAPAAPVAVAGSPASARPRRAGT